MDRSRESDEPESMATTGSTDSSASSLPTVPDTIVVEGDERFRAACDSNASDVNERMRAVCDSDIGSHAGQIDAALASRFHREPSRLDRMREMLGSSVYRYTLQWLLGIVLMLFVVWWRAVMAPLGDDRNIGQAHVTPIDLNAVAKTYDVRPLFEIAEKISYATQDLVFAIGVRHCGDDVDDFSQVLDDASCASMRVTYDVGQDIKTEMKKLHVWLANQYDLDDMRLRALAKDAEALPPVRDLARAAARVQRSADVSRQIQDAVEFGNKLARYWEERRPQWEAAAGRLDEQQAAIRLYQAALDRCTEKVSGTLDRAKQLRAADMDGVSVWVRSWFSRTLSARRKQWLARNTGEDMAQIRRVMTKLQDALQSQLDACVLSKNAYHHMEHIFRGNAELTDLDDRSGPPRSEADESSNFGWLEEMQHRHALVQKNFQDDQQDVTRSLQQVYRDVVAIAACQKQ